MVPLLVMVVLCAGLILLIVEERLASRRYDDSAERLRSLARFYRVKYEEALGCLASQEAITKDLRRTVDFDIRLLSAADTMLQRHRIDSEAV